MERLPTRICTMLTCPQCCSVYKVFNRCFPLHQFQDIKSNEDYANTFDLISFITLIIAYVGTQIFIYLRIRRLKKHNGNRSWSEGKKFINRMCNLRKGCLFYRPTMIEAGNMFENKAGVLVGLARSPEEF